MLKLEVNGDLTMTKPDFNKMTRQELRSYVFAHQEDDDAIEALIKRGNADSPKYRFPETEEDIQQMAEILRKKLGSNQVEKFCSNKYSLKIGLVANKVEFCPSIFSINARFLKDLIAFKISELERSLPSRKQDMETRSF